MLNWYGSLEMNPQGSSILYMFIWVWILYLKLYTVYAPKNVYIYIYINMNTSTDAKNVANLLQNKTGYNLIWN